jgi:hypothetical protein
MAFLKLVFGMLQYLVVYLLVFIILSFRLYTDSLLIVQIRTTNTVSLHDFDTVMEFSGELRFALDTVKPWVSV